MKLPIEYITVIEQAESKDQREQLANHVPVITPGLTASDPHTVAAIVYEPLSIDVLEEAVMDHYHFLNTSRPFEATLAVVQRNYRPADKAKHCYYCHKDGHTKAECRKKKNDRSNKKCTHCGSNTHTAVSYTHLTLPTTAIV